MAKKSAIHRNKKRMIKAERAKETRHALKEAIQSIRIDASKEDEAVNAGIKLGKRKRDESPSRIRRRCRQCGRPHGTYRRFGLCRICLREAAMRGDVPGLRKASW